MLCTKNSFKRIDDGSLYWHHIPGSRQIGKGEIHRNKSFLFEAVVVGCLDADVTTVEEENPTVPISELPAWKTREQALAKTQAGRNVLDSWIATLAAAADLPNFMFKIFGMDELEKIQWIISWKYQIHLLIYELPALLTPKWRGEMNVVGTIGVPVFIITNRRGDFDTLKQGKDGSGRDLCIGCSRFVGRLSRHSCSHPSWCSQCGNFTKQQCQQGENIACEQCGNPHGSFGSSLCFEKHKEVSKRHKTSRCSIWKRCPECGEALSSNTVHRHKCGAKFCSNCLTKQVGEHECSYQKRTKARISNPRSSKPASAEKKAFCTKCMALMPVLHECRQRMGLKAKLMKEEPFS